MRFRYVVAITIVVLAVTIGIGLYQKSFYIDFNEKELPLENCIVGLLPENIAKVQIEHLRENLENISNYIIAVECTSSTLFHYSGTSQEVVVKHIFKGEGLKEEERIKIVRSGTAIFMDEDKPSVNMGFVNEMKQGKEYLIFLDRKIKNTDNFYLQSDDFIVAPIFCYEEIESTVCKSISTQYNAMEYKEASKNEFFFVDETSLNDIQVLKREFISKYSY